MKEAKKGWKLSKTAKNDVENTLKGLLEICQILHLPMFACVITEYKDNAITYDNIVYSAQSHKVRLYDDHIRRHMLVANGFEVSCKTPEVKTDDTPQDELPLSKRFAVYSINDEEMEELTEKIEDVTDLSEKYDTSVFVAVAVSNSVTHTETKSCYKIPKPQKTLKDNVIYKHIQIAEKDFDAVPARDLLSLDMSDMFGDYGI